jgi:sRNA-binding protein
MPQRFEQIMEGLVTWHLTQLRWEECDYNEEDVIQESAKRQRSRNAKQKAKASKKIPAIEERQQSSTAHTGSPAPQDTQGEDWFKTFTASEPRQADKSHIQDAISASFQQKLKLAKDEMNEGILEARFHVTRYSQQ